jgi:hypothetical protein
LARSIRLPVGQPFSLIAATAADSWPLSMARTGTAPANFRLNQLL